MKQSFSPQTVTRFYKGIIAILIRTFQIKPKSILKNMGFIDAIGLKEHLSPTQRTSIHD
jgi:sulfur transfer protein SufE